MTSVAHLLVGNLDFEDHLAPPDPSALGGRVRRALSALATLLRVCAEPGDLLWTRDSVAPARVAPVTGVATPTLVHGADELRARGGAVLAWAESAEVARLRDDSRVAPAVPRDAPVQHLVWRGPFPLAQAARRVSHRGFQLQTATALGVALPGACLLADLPALHAHLHAGGAAAAADERWVLKAPFSAAGRERLRGAGRGDLAPRDAARAARLFARHGALLFEPWMQRTADFGAVGWVDAEGTRLLGLHRQDLDGYGRFRGLTVPVQEAQKAPGLGVDEAEALAATLMQVGQRLWSAGYAGAFGIDAWRYSDCTGCARFHPLGEINPRFTFGLLIHALAARLLAAGERFENLRFGLGRAPAADSVSGTKARTVPLLLPAPDDPTSAWCRTW